MWCATARTLRCRHTARSPSPCTPGAPARWSCRCTALRRSPAATASTSTRLTPPQRALQRATASCRQRPPMSPCRNRALRPQHASRDEWLEQAPLNGLPQLSPNALIVAIIFVQIVVAVVLRVEVITGVIGINRLVIHSSVLAHVLVPALVAPAEVEISRHRRRVLTVPLRRSEIHGRPRPGLQSAQPVGHRG